MSLLGINKTFMYEFWYDYIKLQYQDNAKVCYTDTNSFIIYIKLDIFTKTLLMMLKTGLTHLTMMKMMKEYFQQVKTKK